MAFANRVAEAANAANHHPDIHVEGYKNVRIVLTTHATGGISDADLELAKAIDAPERSGAAPPGPTAPAAR
jgi:4a-hydroxytetrahydrobiopterin dehydratase